MMKQDQLITIDTLKEMGACAGGIRKFKCVFPNGARLNRRNLRHLARLDHSISWFFLQANIHYSKYRVRMAYWNTADALDRDDATKLLIAKSKRLGRAEYKKLEDRLRLANRLAKANRIADLMGLR